MKRGLWLVGLIVAVTFCGSATPLAGAVPAPDIEFLYDTTVRKQYSFANTADAISYAHGICDKITGGTGYAKVIGDVKNDVQPNDEYSANYLISNAVTSIARPNSGSCAIRPVATCRLRSNYPPALPRSGA